MSYRTRKLLPILAVIVGVLALSACTPQQVQWFKNEASPAEQKKIITALQSNASVSSKETWKHPTLTCIRRHESDRGPWPHLNGATAQNPSSSASGHYQFIDSTWRNVSKMAGYPGYSRALHAPSWIQHEVALFAVNKWGASSTMTWYGSGC